MTEVLVDTEKLADGLELGIGHTDTIFASLPPGDRLRMTACGLVSTAIDRYALREGLPSRLMISQPKLPFDADIQHVVVLIDPDGSDPTLIDASPSQFLAYAGLTVAYERLMSQRIFPPEKVLSFRLLDRECIVDWLADAALRFQKINQRPVNNFGIQLGNGPLAQASKEELREVYRTIWDPDNFRSWKPPDHVLRDGEKTSLFIVPDAIIGENPIVDGGCTTQ